MANEIVINATLQYTNAPVAVISRAASTLNVSVVGTKYQQGVQDVGTTEEALTLGEAASGGYVWIKNLDVTNYVEIKSATGVVPLIRLGPAEVCLFRLSATATAPFAQANTAAVKIEVLLLPA